VGGGGVFDGFFHCLAGFAGALLDTTQEFVVFAFDVLEIVVGELGPLLLKFALCDVPVALDFECIYEYFCESPTWRITGSQMWDNPRSLTRSLGIGYGA